MTNYALLSFAKKLGWPLTSMLRKGYLETRFLHSADYARWFGSKRRILSDGRHLMWSPLYLLLGFVCGYFLVLAVEPVQLWRILIIPGALYGIGYLITPQVKSFRVPIDIRFDMADMWLDYNLHQVQFFLFGTILGCFGPEIIQYVIKIIG